MPMLETNTIWKQLLVMVFLTVSVVFAPFSASHASVCENVDGAHYVSAVAHAGSNAVTLAHPDPSHHQTKIAAGLCCVSICSACANSFAPLSAMGRADFQSISYDSVSPALVGQSIPPSLGPPRSIV
jgi:hypothetical protein